jgi:hypothetical protein
MEQLRCSLCGKVGDATPLDMDDAVFGPYVRLLRKFGLSKHKDSLGVCKECMPKYTRMSQEYQKKIITYGILGAAFGIINFWLTKNILVSLIIAAFVFSLSLICYCPPLKKTGV